jgi:hypothetical protein
MKNWWWVLLMVNLSLGAAAAPTIGILQFGQGKPALQKAVRQAVPQAQVVLVSAEDFAAGRVPQAVSVLVVPEAHRLPAIVGEPLQRWIQARKGTLFLSDAVPLQTWLYSARGRWVERDEALKTLSTWRALWQASLPPASEWRRSTDSPQLNASWSLVDTPHGRGWQIRVPRLTNWCTYDIRVEQPFRDGESLMRFWAKGDANTRALSIEWRERDGSRWVATVPLTPQWREVVLAPEQFAYWHDNPSKGRGGKGDRLQPQNTVELSIGLAHSFAAYPANTPLEATIADIRIGRQTQSLPAPVEFTLEGVAPWYKFYTDSRGRLCSVMRYRAVGIGGDAPGRRIVTPLGERCCLFISARGDTEGAIWAWLPTREATASNLAAVLRPDAAGLASAAGGHRAVRILAGRSRAVRRGGGKPARTNRLPPPDRTDNRQRQGYGAPANDGATAPRRTAQGALSVHGFACRRVEGADNRIGARWHARYADARLPRHRQTRFGTADSGAIRQVLPRRGTLLRAWRQLLAAVDCRAGPGPVLGTLACSIPVRPGGGRTCAEDCQTGRV